ncbi:MAG: hypothetical protein EXR78_04055 [Deltaproteobacteria bacterium]|nr:hypothetical protein [Deltaproteobacteria bacterium]
MKTVNASWKQLFSLFCITLLLCAVPTLGLARSQSKTSTKRTTKAKMTRAKASTKKAPPAPAVIDEAAVQSSFETFTLDWMKKLTEAEEYHRRELLKVSQSGDIFSAEYVGYLPQRFVAVKKTTSTETPFIGTLTYYERTLRCTGKTKDAATQGPFEQVETTPVMEIFRFTNGKWVY